MLRNPRERIPSAQPPEGPLQFSRAPAGHPAASRTSSTPPGSRRLRLGDLRRARARADRGGGAAARGRRLRDVGKTNLHEFAYGTTSENPHFGDVPNPRYPGRIAGGSSGGSAAALAAGLADAALGTDSAGSIRIPAACCGVVGHKPTHGLVSLEGCWPLAASFDTAGPMAPTSRDASGCSRVLAPGFEPVELESLEELEVGVAWTELADPLVRTRVEAAAARFPRRRAIELPLVPNETYAVFMREVADVHRELYAENADLYGEDVRIKVETLPRGAGLRGRARRAATGRVPRAGGGCARRARPRADADAADRRAAAAPRRRRRSRRPRAADPLHVPVLGARLAGARAPLRPGRGRIAGVASDRGPRRAPMRSSSPLRACWSRSRPKASEARGR